MLPSAAVVLVEQSPSSEKQPRQPAVNSFGVAGNYYRGGGHYFNQAMPCKPTRPILRRFFIIQGRIMGHGGYREGAGRKPDPVQLCLLPDTDDAMQFLLATMNDNGIDLRLRIDAAKAILAHQKKLTKKESVQRASIIAEHGTEWDGLLTRA